VYRRVNIVEEQPTITLCFRYVDDYFFASNNDVLLEEEIRIMKSKLAYSEMQKDPPTALGMDLKYDKDNCTISLSMSKKIVELKELIFKDAIPRNFRTPMEKGRYIVKDMDFESDSYPYGNDREFLDKEGISMYMKIVGSLVWINGIRFDICFALSYLTWYANKPRRHHLEVAKRVAAYLFHSKDIPLIIGGKELLKIYASSDASLATGPKGKSIVGTLLRFNPKSGAVRAKTKAMMKVALSSFEGEISGLFESFRHSARFRNFWSEIDGLNQEVLEREIECDNASAVYWVCGEAEGSGIKHAEMKFYYMQEEYKSGGVIVKWVEGIKMVCDAMTKILPRKSHEEFRHNIQGLGLVSEFLPQGDFSDDES
jgi:hypothetical protein